MEHNAIHFHWNFLIAFYLFTAGISAGAFFVSGLATYLGGERYKRISRIGALLAPWPLSLGLAALIFDLTKPFQFWWLFLTVEYTSPMSIGSWLLTGFSLLSFVYFVLWLPRPWRDLLRLPHSLSELTAWNTWRPLDPSEVNVARRIVAAVGAPLAIGVGMYTGVLLGAIPARPLWNTPMVAQLFLMSAMSSGVATVLLVASLMRSHHLRSERHFLVSFDAMLIVLEIFMIIPFFLHQTLSTWSASGSLNLVMGGPFTLAFWGGVILLGLLIPLAIEGFELFLVVWQEHAVKYSRLWGGLSAGLVLIGGFALRYVFVYAGQMSHFLPLYVR
ncbi:MAG: polysulfide reductase [Anaerolineae bacterium]|nr:polysulfide reductase NrfD [Anaerolineales bacterium]MCQ3973599.1 polysulfide reductase [Anaerolineae bacterium]